MVKTVTVGSGDFRCQLVETCIVNVVASVFGRKLEGVFFKLLHETTLGRVDFPVCGTKRKVVVKSAFAQVSFKWNDVSIPVGNDFFSGRIDDSLKKCGVAGNIIPFAFQLVRSEEHTSELQSRENI